MMLTERVRFMLIERGGRHLPARLYASMHCIVPGQDELVLDVVWQRESRHDGILYKCSESSPMALIKAEQPGKECF